MRSSVDACSETLQPTLYPPLLPTLQCGCAGLRKAAVASSFWISLGPCCKHPCS